jgi:hypothetical protein
MHVFWATQHTLSLQGAPAGQLPQSTICAQSFVKLPQLYIWLVHVFLAAQQTLSLQGSPAGHDPHLSTCPQLSVKLPQLYAWLSQVCVGVQHVLPDSPDTQTAGAVQPQLSVPPHPSGNWPQSPFPH